MSKKISQKQNQKPSPKNPNKEDAITEFPSMGTIFYPGPDPLKRLPKPKQKNPNPVVKNPKPRKVGKKK
jgi:hypothetical protein